MQRHHPTTAPRRIRRLGRALLALLAGAAATAAILAFPGVASAHDPYFPCVTSQRTDCIGVNHFLIDRTPGAEMIYIVRPRFAPRFSAPAYLASSPGPVIERRAVWEPWTDGGSTIGW
jgi:hypothetical protein